MDTIPVGRASWTRGGEVGDKDTQESRRWGAPSVRGWRVVDVDTMTTGKPRSAAVPVAMEAYRGVVFERVDWGRGVEASKGTGRGDYRPDHGQADRVFGR